MNAMRTFAKTAWIALGLVSAWAHASTLQLEELMASLAAIPSGEARFTEQRHVLQLDQTLVSSGRLSFTAPDTFVRETLKPRQEKLAVTGNTVTMSQGSRRRTVALDATPEAQVIVEAIRGTLTGNREVLERHFTVQLDGTLARWTLELVPRDARLRGQVARVALSGQRAAVSEVRILMTDGDRSVMQIEPVAPASR